MSELTRAQINTILRYPIDDTAIDAILAHDAALRAKVEALEQANATLTAENDHVREALRNFWNALNTPAQKGSSPS